MIVDMNGRAVFVPVAGGWAENVIHLSDQIKGLTVGANDRFAAIEARLDAHDNLFVEVTGWLKAQQEINRLSQLKVHTPTPEPSLEVEPHEVEPRRTRRPLQGGDDMTQMKNPAGQRGISESRSGTNREQPNNTMVPEAATGCATPLQKHQ